MLKVKEPPGCLLVGLMQPHLEQSLGTIPVGSTQSQLHIHCAASALADTITNNPFEIGPNKLSAHVVSSREMAVCDINRTQSCGVRIFRLCLSQFAVSRDPTCNLQMRVQAL